MQMFPFSPLYLTPRIPHLPFPVAATTLLSVPISCAYMSLANPFTFTLPTVCSTYSALISLFKREIAETLERTSFTGHVWHFLHRPIFPPVLYLEVSRTQDTWLVLLDSPTTKAAGRGHPLLIPFTASVTCSHFQEELFWTWGPLCFLLHLFFHFCSNAHWVYYNFKSIFYAFQADKASSSLMGKNSLGFICTMLI